MLCMGHTVQIYNKILLLFKKLNITLLCWSKRSNSPDGGKSKVDILSILSPFGLNQYCIRTTEGVIRDWLFQSVFIFIYLFKKKLSDALWRNLTPFLFIMIQSQQTESTSTSSNSPVTLRFILLNWICKINTTKPLQSLGWRYYVKGAEPIFLVDTKKNTSSELIF